MYTTVTTIQGLSLDVNVPRQLHRVGIERRSLRRLTVSTFGSIYANNGPEPASIRSVRTLCRGTFWNGHCFELRICSHP